MLREINGIRRPLTWLGGLLVVYLAVPIAAFVLRFGQSHQRGFATPGLWSALRVSVVSATVSTAIIVVLGIPLAYSLARSRGRLVGIVGVVVQLPLALPPLMSGILLIYLVGPYTTLGRLFHGGLTNSGVGIVLAETFVSAPFLVIAARSAFATVNPALDEVAATLGHRPLARFLQVSLPVAAPGIGAGMLLAWLRSFGEYGATVLLAYHPYSLPVFTEVQFSGSGLPPTQAPTALALIVAGAAVVLSRGRIFRRRRRASSLPPPRHPSATKPTSVSFDLDVRVGTFHLDVAHRAETHRLAILGPSGSGKSLTLRSLAGLQGREAGPVSYGDVPMRAVPTEARGIGYVPQSLGLLPHRTVWQQLIFAHHADEGVAAWWFDNLHLDGLQDRYLDELSGGQQQRVSLAQAFSRNPRLVLLDEPFSGLDAPVRDELRREVRRLQTDAGLSTVLVTHDPEEAALLADEVVVIAEGRVLQAGRLAAVFARPASPEVARVLGMHNLNGGRTISETAFSAGPLIIDADHGLAPGTEIVWCIRPEHVLLTTAGRHRAQVTDVAHLGAVTAITVRLADQMDLQVRAIKPAALAIGSECRLDLGPDDILVWPTVGVAVSAADVR